MDATQPQPRPGNRQHRFAIVAVAFFAALLVNSVSDAQGLRLRSRGDDQQLAHSITSSVQTFPPVRWEIQNAVLPDGCLVEWTAESFAHRRLPSVRADCELGVAIVQGSRNARWTVISPFDTSNLASGKNTATVAVSSQRRGRAEVELTVSFKNNDVRKLASGSYQTFVTGTISGL